MVEWCVGGGAEERRFGGVWRGEGDMDGVRVLEGWSRVTGWEGGCVSWISEDGRVWGKGCPGRVRKL